MHPRRSHARAILLPALLMLAALALLSACATLLPARAIAWTPAELDAIRSLWIGSLPPVPPDPSNRWADDPRAAALGRDIFFDPAFSANGAVACANCHQPEYGFTDPLPRGQGMALSRRRTMPITAAAWSPWLFWDGRKDSLWSQALEPLQDPNEHGISRDDALRALRAGYADDYAAVFGPLPDLDDPAGMDEDAANRAFANLGKAVAAFERTLSPSPTRFDRYAEILLSGDLAAAGEILTPDEQAGLRLFIGDAQCTNCHNGPLFTNHAFHNTGVPLAAGETPDEGRAAAIPLLLADPFNCLGPYSDAAGDCPELQFLQTQGHELLGAFKPPSLRGVASRPPYMHNGVFKTLEEVIQHYNQAPLAPISHSELVPLRLSAKQRAQLLAFLKTLDSGGM